MNRFSVEFLVRTGCHLCDDMAPTVRRAARWAVASVETIDIDSDDALVRDYGLQVPVVLANGEAIAEGIVGLATLWTRIMRRRFFG
ncbi:MAG: glutaredoxin family protein [Acidimicrobiia bacterium]